jgi:hypothetical protein
MDGATILGFVVFSFSGWDAYITASKKWPESSESIGKHTSDFYEARRSVQMEILFREGRS